MCTSEAVIKIKSIRKKNQRRKPNAKSENKLFKEQGCATAMIPKATKNSNQQDQAEQPQVQHINASMNWNEIIT